MEPAYKGPAYKERPLIWNKLSYPEVFLISGFHCISLNVINSGWIFGGETVRFVLEWEETFCHVKTEKAVGNLPGRDVIVSASILEL